LFALDASRAQIETPVKWSCAAKKISPTEAVVLFKAMIDSGWHIYSAYQEDGGPVKTSFSFAKSSEFTINGKPREPKPKKSFEKTFGIYVLTFKKEVIFQQKVKLKAKEAVVKGSLEYMACNDHQCLPPETVDFSIPVK